MRLSDLWHARVRTLDGKSLGRVHEVHADGGRIVAVSCGPGSIIERLTARGAGRKIPWENVRRIADGEIFVTDEPPRQKSTGKSPKTTSASRSRQGTRRPSAPRSRR